MAGHACATATAAAAAEEDRSMQFRRRDHFVALATVIGAATVVPTKAFAADIVATVVAGHPPAYRWVRMIDESFAPAVRSALAGGDYTLAINGKYGGALTGVGEELETVGSGLAEIGICQSVFDPSALSLQNVTYYTPFVSDDVHTVAAVMDVMQDDDARMADLWADNGTVYLGAPVIIDDYLLMTAFPIETLADLDGRKIAAPGAAINWLSGTGAVGVSGNLTTYYNEIRTNVYDGAVVFASAALPGKLYEVAPYITRVGLGAQFAGGLCANRDWYDELPDEVQQALDIGANAAGEWYLAELAAAVDLAFMVMEERGAMITDASDEFRQAWANGMDDAARAWVDELERRGLDASGVLSDYMAAMRAAGVTPLRDWDID